MKLQNKQSRFIKPGLVFLLITLVVIGIYSCNKKEKADAECVKCEQNKNTQTKDIVVKDKIYIVPTYTSSSGKPTTTIITEKEMPDVVDEIQSTLKSYGIEVLNCKPFGLAKFYEKSIEESNKESIAPSAILLYYTNEANGRSFASIWKRDENNKKFSFIPNLSGITTFVARNDFYKIEEILSMGTQEILLLLDHAKLPETVYPTIFQVKLDKEYENSRPTGGGGGGGTGGSTYCRSSDQCPEECIGWCYFEKDHQDDCMCIGQVCPTDNAISVLEAEGYSLSQGDIDYLYTIRDEYLLNSEKGQQMIDDYFYSGIIMKGKVPLSLATKLYHLFGIDLFRKMSYFNTTTYDGEILIRDKEKEIIIEMCDETKMISNDLRFQSIIKNVETDVNRFYNQPIIDIKNAFN
jgi:hypothetical protein